MTVNLRSLPEVLIGEIYSYLTPEEFACNESVCRQWRSLLHVFWKKRPDLQGFSLVKNFSYNRQALSLFAEATLQSSVFIPTSCHEGRNGHDPFEVVIRIYNLCNELMSLQLKITENPAFTQSVSLKCFIKEDGGYKTTDDQVVITYRERDLVLKLRNYKSKPFDKALEDEIQRQKRVLNSSMTTL